MRQLIPLALVAGLSFGFPMLNERDSRPRVPKQCRTSKVCDTEVHVSDEDIGVTGKQTPAQKISAARTNCGFLTPCRSFDREEQYVSTSGKHAFMKPTNRQIRGPCPGLNAAANHDYLPRDGVQTIGQTISGLGDAYGMSLDLAAFLATYAIAFDGDIATMTWSLGGPQPLTGLGKIGKGLLDRPQGISYSHNKYEGDTSIGRCDAFLNDGDAHSLSVQRFKYAYEYGMEDGSNRYNLDKFSQNFAKNTFRSIRQNPLYTAPFFSTTLVAPAAYNFVINFMSNRTAEEPSGYLNGDMFKQFFSIKGEYPNFYWAPGEDRIPDNWYRRPKSDPYTATSVFRDLAAEFAAYPTSFRFGGNAHGKDSYVGIDIANLTGGVYSAKDLTKPENLACFFYRQEQQIIPDQLRNGFNEFNKALDLVLGSLDKTFAKFNCPKVGKFKDNPIKKYPGHEYNPHGPATSC